MSQSADVGDSPCGVANDEARIALTMDKTAARSLPEEPRLYFYPLDGVEFVPLARLVPSKSPESQPDSVARAEERMRAAAEGTATRRQPISVRQLPDGRYLITGGNATFGAALRAGWSAIPATVEALA